MADQSDVETALVALASAALYPNGTAAASVCGATCRVFRGWPNSAALEADLAAGAVNVSVFPVGGTERLTTRYPDAWQTLPAPALSLTVTTAANVATFAGSGAEGQLAGVAAGGQSWVYQVQDRDGADLVAASLAALISPDALVQVSGAQLTMPAVPALIARVVANVPAIREVRRQMQEFRLSCWCPDYATRDAVAGAIDAAFAPLAFIDLADGTQGRLLFRGSVANDDNQAAGLYRRDLLYGVEYATTATAAQPEMLFGYGDVNAIARYIS
jgi:hypothetical protein